MMNNSKNSFMDSIKIGKFSGIQDTIDFNANSARELLFQGLGWFALNNNKKAGICISKAIKKNTDFIKAN